MENENFLFRNFYKKRARRILPALFFVMLATIPFSWIYLYPIDLINFSKSILYSLGFGSNFYFHYSGLDYGSPEGLLKPFLHTWSLSVEEQYYLLFPLVLVAIFRFFRKFTLYFLLISFLVSLVLADYGSRNYPSSTFYFLHSRIWELIGGSLIAYYENKFGHRNENNILSKIFPSLGLLLIIYSIFYFDNSIFHPSFYTLIPVTGVALILWFSNKNEIIFKILSYKLLVGIGLISYSLYLWHYPIFSFAKNLELYQSYFGKFILIFISFILSIFTYYFIEQPARKTKNTKIVFSMVLFGACLIFVYSVIVIKENGFVNRVKVKNYQDKHSYLYLTQENKPCFGRNKNLCKFGSHEQQIILLGDSHLGSLAFDLYNRTRSNYTFVPITNAGYFHLREIKLLNKHTKKINTNYDNLRNDIDKILNKSKNNIIIIGGATSLYFYNKRIKDRALHWDGLFVDKDNLRYEPHTVEEAFVSLIEELSINNEVILLYPIPEIGVNLQKIKFENMIRVFNYKYSNFLEQNNEVINFFDSINIPKVHKVYPYSVFCAQGKKLCSTHDKNNFFFFDGYHPSLEGAKMINDLIIKKINFIENNK